MKLIIPAREGSKGLRYKNRYLFDYTAKIIPSNLKGDVFVTTDDDKIIDAAKGYGFNIIHREPELCRDNVSIKHVLEDTVNRAKIDDDIIMLYLTYPKRTWNDVNDFYSFYLANNRAPTICKKDVDNHPYLCYYNLCGGKGKKVIEHDLYRRQDYPSCFQICHFLFGCKSNDLSMLDLNLFCDKAVFYKVEKEKCLDIDTPDDFKEM